MSKIHALDYHAAELPAIFPSPFNECPHPVASFAAAQLQARLGALNVGQHDFQARDGGKMLGVLVVRDRQGRLGFLAAFSGMLAGRWQWPGFVPPVFDEAQRDAFLSKGEADLQALTAKIKALQQTRQDSGVAQQLEELAAAAASQIQLMQHRHRQHRQQRRQQRQRINAWRDPLRRDTALARLSFASQQDKRELRALKQHWQAQQLPLQSYLAGLDEQIEALSQARAAASLDLQQRVFAGYRLANMQGEQQPLADFFAGGLPPGGAGDCAGPKLLQYAARQQLQPIALAEFWWGAAPRDAVRHHARFYPACRGKCQPILPYMLRGLMLQPSAGHRPPVVDAEALAVIYEDEALLVVNKPEGLLSVPGKEVEDSVLTRMRQRYPQASGAMLVHRLDMSTSGLLLVAKTAGVHKALQRQFLQRSIEKRYVAILSRRLPEGRDEGEIELPLRVDLDDRPRQLVCYRHGKVARTRWQVIERGADFTRVYFYPLTGRTHQLRVHAAHAQGLQAAIVGDELYGQRDLRLMLHAERLVFSHPLTGAKMHLTAAVPF